jgi:hypothetical protein
MLTWISELGESHIRGIQNIVMSPVGLWPEKFCAGEASNNCILQIWPLVGEGLQSQQNRNYVKMLKREEKFVADSTWVPDTKIDWPTDIRP